MRRASCLIVAFLTLSGAAHAACTVSATPVDFGNYSPFLNSPQDSVGQVSVNCTDSGTYTVAMNAGVNAGGSFGNRRLTNGDTFLAYQLYTDSTRSTVWGDGSGGSTLISRSGSDTIPMYGRVPAHQSVSAGAFTDTILITIAY